jgi:hypothetical protein
MNHAPPTLWRGPDITRFAREKIELPINISDLREANCVLFDSDDPGNVLCDPARTLAFIGRRLARIQDGRRNGVFLAIKNKFINAQRKMKQC